MLVRECAPGDLVKTTGFDVVQAVGNPTPGLFKTAYLIPQMYDMTLSRTMLYLGSAYITRDPPGRHKVHHFLTDTGDSVALHGTEFKFLSPCKA